MTALDDSRPLTPNPPPIARDFWHRDYPAMTSREKNGDAIERANYQLIESFALPEAAWWAFYGPLEERIARLREKYAAGEHTEAAAKTLDEVQREIDVFRASSSSYSYVFYVARRPL